MLKRRIPILIVFVLCMLSISACGSSAKSEKEIANELAQVDPYFVIYSLSIDDYSVEKRQTNKDEKTDYVWITIEGSNEDFSYTADYEVAYVLYNDGWLLEDYSIQSYSYSVKEEFDRTTVENELSQQYDTYSYVSMDQDGNEISLIYDAEVSENYILKEYTLEINYEYTPETGWKQVDISEDQTDEKLDIIGEWIYSDDDGTYYYIHVSEVDGYEVTYEYLLCQTSSNKADWQYVYSDGYVSELYSSYSNEYTGVHEDVFYRYINVNTEHTHVSGDANCKWFYTESTLMTTGEESDGFYINGHFLERENDSAEPIIGLDESYIQDIESDSNKTSVDEEATVDDYDVIVSYCEEGELEAALSYINELDEISDEISSIKSEINTFIEKYSAWLGDWSLSKNSDDVYLTIKAGYDDGIVLKFYRGVTTSGDQIVYDLYEEGTDYLMYHSTQYDAFTYTTLEYISDDEIDMSTETTNTGNTTSKELYRIQ